jgi:hypothetical protein
MAKSKNRSAKGGGNKNRTSSSRRVLQRTRQANQSNGSDVPF